MSSVSNKRSSVTAFAFDELELEAEFELDEADAAGAVAFDFNAALELDDPAEFELEEAEGALGTADFGFFAARETGLPAPAVCGCASSSFRLTPVDDFVAAFDSSSRALLGPAALELLGFIAFNSARSSAKFNPTLPQKFHAYIQGRRMQYGKQRHSGEAKRQSKKLQGRTQS